MIRDNIFRESPVRDFPGYKFRDATPFPMMGQQADNCRKRKGTAIIHHMRETFQRDEWTGMSVGGRRFVCHNEMMLSDQPVTFEKSTQTMNSGFFTENKKTRESLSFKEGDFRFFPGKLNIRLKESISKRIYICKWIPIRTSQRPKSP